jgi:uncharacterized repeat protein (TIGR03803 family)
MQHRSERTIARLFLFVILFTVGFAQPTYAQIQTLYNFPKSLHGCEPAHLIMDEAGNLYGTAGDPNWTPNCGMIFELQPQGNGQWKFQLLHALRNNTQISQQAPLTRDAQGNLYAGIVKNLYGANSRSAIVELSRGANGRWTYKLIYEFGPGNGSLPSSLIVDASGNLFGTTFLGGTGSSGMVFELSPGAGGQWTEQVLYNFSGYFDDPDGLIMDAAGNLFGTTYYGGFCSNGSVFEVDKSSGGWPYSLLYSFCGNNSGGILASGGLVFDAAGNLYGTNTQGSGQACGMTGCGTVFELSQQNGWAEGTIFEFNNSDGIGPFALTIDAAGELYGMTASGGGGFGTMFKLSPGGNRQWTEQTVYRFKLNGIHTKYPCCNLLVDSAGNVFGATTSVENTGTQYYEWGSVFEYAPTSMRTP